MNKKKLIPAIAGISLSVALLLAGCAGGQTPSAGTDTQQQNAAAGTVTYKWDFVKKGDAIANLKAECDQKGTVESMEYQTPLYATGSDEIVTKKLYIYLPYGYDESEDYNILYLMHGGGENESYWLADERFGPTTRNVLDNMIKDGLCDPFLVVTPTFYPPVSTETENSTEEDFAAAAANLTVAFGQELRNNVIPAVESVYPTYAKGDVSEENLRATRDHRAFAGFSMGSMTSIHSAMMQDLDLISWIGSYSGAKTEVSEFKSALESDALKDYDVKFWYNGNGKGDIAHDEHDKFCHGVAAAMPDRFTDGENFAWIDLRDGAHMYGSWIADLYNCMLVFFKS